MSSNNFKDRLHDIFLLAMNARQKFHLLTVVNWIDTKASTAEQNQYWYPVPHEFLRVVLKTQSR